MCIGDVTRRIGEPLDATGTIQSADELDRYSMHSFGAVFVEVAVDPDLGPVRVPRVIGTYAAGQTNTSPPALEPSRSGTTVRAVHKPSVRPPDSGGQPDNPAAEDGQRPTQGGTHIILAHDGSIVFVGPGGRLTANTGETSASGSVAVGVEDSELKTGTSTIPTKVVGLQRPQVADAVSHANASFLGVFPREAESSGKAVAISGFEDHSVSAVGNDQIITYDDSNVFVERQGLINANTGDTDSSGLNVVDATYSRIRSGNSGDAEGTEDDEEEPEDPDEEEDSPDEEPELPASRAVGLPGGSTGPRQLARPQEPSAVPNGSNDDSEDSGDPVAPSVQLQNGQSFGTVTDEGATTAIGNNTFVVGADGFDDVSIRSAGDRNLITYDDSNVVIGGVGGVNAQIGDNDTGGTMVMAAHFSDIQAGCEGDLCYTDVEARQEPVQSLGLPGVVPPALGSRGVWSGLCSGADGSPLRLDPRQRIPWWLTSEYLRQARCWAAILAGSR